MSIHSDVIVSSDEIQMATCDGTEYDIAKERCCVNMLYAVKTGSESCCDWKLLDTVNEQCCNGFVMDLADACKFDQPLKYDMKSKTDASDV